MKGKFDAILKRADDRNAFYKILYKMVAVCLMKNVRIVIENPFSELHYLHNNFLEEPTFVDTDRTRRGDFYKKPTGFWYFGCRPTQGCTFQKPKKVLTILNSKSAPKAGICSEDRSMISPDYARNFICDFILGKEQVGSQLSMFD